MSTLFDHWHVYPPFLIDEALLSISPAGRGQLLKMLIILELHACQHCLTTGMCIHLFLMDEALLSISPAGRGQLVKMLITLELHACQHCLTTGMCIHLF